MKIKTVRMGGSGEGWMGEVEGDGWVEVERDGWVKWRGMDGLGRGGKG